MGKEKEPAEEAEGDSKCQICNKGEVQRIVRGRCCWETPFYSCDECGATTNALLVEKPEEADKELAAPSIALGPPISADPEPVADPAKDPAKDK